jgi:Fe-S cluster biogenesis protein NfuA
MMFIQTENTPNPDTIKFLPGVPVMEQGVFEFTNGEMASKSPLAERLFDIQGVHSVFFGKEFVSVTRTPNTEWSSIKARVLSAIMQHFSMGEPRFFDMGDLSIATNDDLLDEISKQIKELIETRVRPAVAQDGGDIVFEKFDRGIVYLKMQGACSGCPSSTITLKNGVENMLRHYVPEVLEVRQSFE